MPHSSNPDLPFGPDELNAYMGADRALNLILHLCLGPILAWRTLTLELTLEECCNDRPLVLHVRVVTGNGGGPEKTIINSPRFLSELGYESVCVYLHPENDPGIESIRARAKQAHAELIAIPDRGAFDTRTVRSLMDICRERNVAIWHSHDYKTDALGILAARRHPMKLVSTVHGWGVRNRKTPIYHAIDRAALRRFDNVICVSDALYNECIRSRVATDRCSQIANGIDLAMYEDLPDSTEARRDFGCDDGSFVVGGFGRLSPEKGFDHLIRAVELLIDTGIEARLIIGGAGPCEPHLASLIQSSPHSQKMQLVGHVPDPRVFFAALDAFVISSDYEGLPNVLLESLACGVPTVTTAVGGIPTVVQHERDALLVSPQSPQQWAIELARLAHNPELYQRLQVNGKRTLTERFSFATRMKKIAAVYDKVLGKSSELRFEYVMPTRLPDIVAEESSRCIDLETVRTGHNFDEFDGESLDTNAGLDSSTKTRIQQKSTSGSTIAVDGQLQVETTSTPEQWDSYLEARGHRGFYQRAKWVRVLARGLQHEPICVQAMTGGQLVGVLPLMLVKSRLFGRFLASLPYLNSGGIIADNESAAIAIVDRAIDLADHHNVRYLELRHEGPGERQPGTCVDNGCKHEINDVVHPVNHEKLQAVVTDKVHMRLPLPTTTDELWSALKSKVRSQIRKPLKNEGFEVSWGGVELLDQFYNIFCRNMRDLGTPPFDRRLFASMLTEFDQTVEICVVRLNGLSVASAVLVHGPGVTEVPSASSLRQFNSTNANMLMYWHLLRRAIERGQHTFDFGRSSKDTGTYRFKAQWGAQESPAIWQHYVREGSAQDMRPNNAKFDLMIKAWQKLPVWFTKLIGPRIVRGIP